MQRGRAHDNGFTSDDVGEVIGLAARLDELSEANGLTLGQLASVADELGVSRRSLIAAVRRRSRQQRADSRARARQVRRRMRFIRHLTVYLVTIAALLVMDAAGGGGWWFFYPAALWGAVVVLHGMRFVTGRRGPVERFVAGRVG